LNLQSSQCKLVSQIQQLHCAGPKFDQLLLGKVLEHLQLIFDRQLQLRNFVFFVIGDPIDVAQLVHCWTHAKKGVNHEAELTGIEVWILGDVVDGISIVIIAFADIRQRAKEKVAEITGIACQNLMLTVTYLSIYQYIYCTCT
jgi:hypothetical protein